MNGYGIIKVLRRICGPVCIQGEWRLRTNAELDNLLGHAELDLLSLSWLGHVERMEEKRMQKKDGEKDSKSTGMEEVFFP
jgi:hypothetical protein